MWLSRTCTLSHTLRWCVTSKVAFRRIYLSKIFYSGGVSDAYFSLVENGTLQRDDLQESVVAKLDTLGDTLQLYETSAPSSGSGSFFGSFFQKKQPAPNGVYLYGSVGCGKTMLMDLLYENIDIVKKKRLHFNEFMIDVHKRIHAFKRQAPSVNHSDKSSRALDPIPPVAADISDEILFLCFDEFQVTDVADAMIMKRLFTCLFENGTVVMATSNRHPSELYKNGLQRTNFLPFIPILEKHCHVVHLKSIIDYRSIDMSVLPGIYFDSNDPDCKENINKAFRILCVNEEKSGHHVESRVLEVFGRHLIVETACGNVARFTFQELCMRALGAADYLTIAENFNTIVIEDIPLLGGKQKVEIKRFIVMIDNLYDSNVRVVCSAERPIAELFDIGSLGADDHDKHRLIMDDLGIKLGDVDSTSSLFTFEEELFAIKRTVSRLTEMMSEQYWSDQN